MAARSGGISGIGVSLATAGAFLMYVGIRDVPIVEGLREITSGRMPEGRPKKKTGVNFVLPGSGGTGGGTAGGDTAQVSLSGGSNPAFAKEAERYLGVPYVWGGTTPRGFDCSGLVQYVISRVTGRPQKSLPRTTYTQIVWKEFKTIPRSEVGAGDFVYWNGHCGIAINNTQMIHAPRPGRPVRVETINNGGPFPGPPLACKRYVGKKTVTAEA